MKKKTIFLLIGILLKIIYVTVCCLNPTWINNFAGMYLAYVSVELVISCIWIPILFLNCAGLAIAQHVMGETAQAVINDGTPSFESTKGHYRILKMAFYGIHLPFIIFLGSQGFWWTFILVFLLAITNFVILHFRRKAITQYEEMKQKIEEEADEEEADGEEADGEETTVVEVVPQEETEEFKS